MPALPRPKTAFPTTQSDLARPDHEIPTVYATLRSLRSTTLALPSRLRSISSDSAFITSLATQTSLPLLANERCGSWYIPPSLKSGSAYFKSTDGHVGQWTFSLRRLNLEVLRMLGERGGAVLVDSTRRGKSMPDALRRTVPIWVGVWNMLLFGEVGELQGPEGKEGVEVGEKRIVEGRFEAWCAGVSELGLDLAALRKVVQRRIRCVWAVNGEWDCERPWAEFLEEEGVGRDENVLVLASASRRVRGAEMSEGGYVQGAADDSEGWSRGLTSELWWENQEELLLQCEDGEIEKLVDRLVAGDRVGVEQRGMSDLVHVKGARNIWIAKGLRDDAEEFDLVINCNGTAQATKGVLSLGCKEGKMGSRELRDKLAQVKITVAGVLQGNPDSRILITCSTGKDLSIGVALCLICLFFDDSGRHIPPRYCVMGPMLTCDTSGILIPQGWHGFIDKLVIKQRLIWITTCKPEANPSRATLQAVNSYLMDRPG
jgi:tRNA A64-2'-O-ribosylphosphate transferase